MARKVNLRIWRGDATDGGLQDVQVEANDGEVVLDVQGLSREGQFGDISFNVRAGEIVALAGLVGSGRSEVARAIFGVDRYDSGSITVNGLGLNVGSPSAAMNAGIALVPEDRRQQGDGESVWAGGANHYIITRPPSTPSTCPVTYEASRDAR